MKKLLPMCPLGNGQPLKLNEKASASQAKYLCDATIPHVFDVLSPIECFARTIYLLVSSEKWQP